MDRAPGTSTQSASFVDYGLCSRRRNVDAVSAARDTRYRCTFFGLAVERLTFGKKEDTFINSMYIHIHVHERVYTILMILFLQMSSTGIAFSRTITQNLFSYRYLMKFHTHETKYLGQKILTNTSKFVCMVKNTSK